jgi:hypothetical protein
MPTPKAPDEHEEQIEAVNAGDQRDEEVEISEEEWGIYSAIRTQQEQHPQPIDDDDEDF